MNGKRYTYPGRSAGDSSLEQKSAEVIVGRKRAISDAKGKDGSLTDNPKDGMLEWQMSYVILLIQQEKPKHVRELLIYEDRSATESKI